MIDEAQGAALQVIWREPGLGSGAGAEGHLKRGAHTDSTLGPDPAAMLINNLFCNGETQACITFGRCGPCASFLEASEDIIEFLRGHPRSIVLDRNQSAVPFGSDPDFDGGAIGRVFDRVADQVIKNGPHL